MPKQSFQSLLISCDAESSLHWKSETGSTSPYHKLSKCFKIMNIPWLSKSWYYKIQDKSTFEVATEAWTKEQELNVLQWNQRYLILSEDGCCHNAGNNPEYLSYSLFDQNLKKIIASSLIQLTEVYGSSNRMEKALLMKVQEKVKGKQLKIKLLTTDCHCQNKEYLREKEEDINH